MHFLAAIRIWLSTLLQLVLGPSRPGKTIYRDEGDKGDRILKQFGRNQNL